MKLHSIKLGVLAVSALVLSGCAAGSPNSREDDPASGPSITVSESDYQPEGRTLHQEFVIRGDTLGTVLLGGSGSCPPVIKEATFEDETLRVVLDSEAYKNKMCTMDYRLHAYDLEISGSKFTPSTKAYLVSGPTETELDVFSE